MTCEMYDDVMKSGSTNRSSIDSKQLWSSVAPGRCSVTRCTRSFAVRSDSTLARKNLPVVPMQENGMP